MSEFSGSNEPWFDEISIMVPSYSVEDLPTDLEEDAAEGLLNAFAIAWHPRLLSCARGIPTVRQADSVHQLSGRHLLIVPPYSEDWMSHDWRDGSARFLHGVLAGCQTRAEWLAAVESLLNETHMHPTDSTDGDLDGSSGNFRQGSDGEPVSRPSAGSIDTSANPTDSDQVAPFLSLGITWLMTVLTSRRMHHFVDPDESLLASEVHQAAEAMIHGDSANAQQHLERCFEQLLETRERFYPLPCYLVDMCIPPGDVDADSLREAILNSSGLNTVATGRDLGRWFKQSPQLLALAKERIQDGRLLLLSGNAMEVRNSLVPLTASLADIEKCQADLQRNYGIYVQHWARKRFGLVASLPMLLSHLGFQSACHVALDDGLYPDKERGQFDWQAPSGAFLSATSRIPLAIDSAASMLRLPDRLQECMQDDSIAVLYLARLPRLNSPWLGDLRIASRFGAPLGQFVTAEQLANQTAGQRNRLKFDHSEYLSPYLIQAAVLKTENPVSGPASLSQLWRDIESVRTLHAVAAMLGMNSREEFEQPNSTDISAGIDNQEIASRDLAHLQVELLELENEHAEIGMRVDDPFDGRQNQLHVEEQLRQKLSDLAVELVGRFGEVLGNPLHGQRGVLLVNPLPFGRTVVTSWSSEWKLPKRNPAIEAIGEPLKEDVRLNHSGPIDRPCVVKMPPGGLVWLTEATDGVSAACVFKSQRRELPLAEDHKLRNRHFEVTISERHGGIESVMMHNSRSNCMSQHVAYRFEREQRIEQDGEVLSASHYGLTEMVSQRVIHADALLGVLETSFQITSFANGQLLAAGRQTVMIDRFRPQLSIRIEIDTIDVAVKGNPWMEYLGCRFAWENETAAISRSVWGQVAGFRAERFESGDYFEVADNDQRLLVIPHGRPYHRRSGPRMIDSLLICESETSRHFQFTVVFDQPFPMRHASDAMTPVICCNTVGRDPGTRSFSWLWGLSAKNIMLVRMNSVDADFEKDNNDVAPSRLIRLLLIETEGMIADCMIRTAINPVSARIILHDGSLVEALPVSEDGILVRFNRFELKEVELQF